MQKALVYTTRKYLLLLAVARNKEVKIILGAALTNQLGWHSTNEQWLDISSVEDWTKIFKSKRLIKCAVAEHVFEHLTPKQMETAIGLVYEHMLSGGTIRIAVPDGNHPNEDYRKHTGIGGIGDDAADHKQFLTFETLKCALEHAGFSVIHQEGYARDGSLRKKFLDPELGYINRSRSALKLQIESEGWRFVDAQTSLVVDGIKNG